MGASKYKDPFSTEEGNQAMDETRDNEAESTAVLYRRAVTPSAIPASPQKDETFNNNPPFRSVLLVRSLSIYIRVQELTQRLFLYSPCDNVVNSLLPRHYFDTLVAFLTSRDKTFCRSYCPPAWYNHHVNRARISWSRTSKIWMKTLMNIKTLKLFSPHNSEWRTTFRDKLFSLSMWPQWLSLFWAPL